MWSPASSGAITVTVSATTSVGAARAPRRARTTVPRGLAARPVGVAAGLSLSLSLLVAVLVVGAESHETFYLEENCGSYIVVNVSQPSKFVVRLLPGDSARSTVATTTASTTSQTTATTTQTAATTTDVAADAAPTTNADSGNSRSRRRRRRRRQPQIQYLRPRDVGATVAAAADGNATCPGGVTLSFRWPNYEQLWLTAVVRDAQFVADPEATRSHGGCNDVHSLQILTHEGVRSIVGPSEFSQRFTSTLRLQYYRLRPLDERSRLDMTIKIEPFNLTSRAEYYNSHNYQNVSLEEYCNRTVVENVSDGTVRWSLNVAPPPPLLNSEGDSNDGDRADPGSQQQPAGASCFAAFNFHITSGTSSVAMAAGTANSSSTTTTSVGDAGSNNSSSSSSSSSDGGGQRDRRSAGATASSSQPYFVAVDVRRSQLLEKKLPRHGCLVDQQIVLRGRGWIHTLDPRRESSLLMRQAGPVFFGYFRRKLLREDLDLDLALRINEGDAYVTDVEYEEQQEEQQPSEV